jgi:SNF2 family DNA or RNA helicase
LDEIAIQPGLPIILQVLVDTAVSQAPTEDLALSPPLALSCTLDLQLPDGEFLWDADGLRAQDDIATYEHFHSLERPSVDGTIYLKDTPQQTLPGFGKSDQPADDDRIRVVTLSQRRSSPQAPQGLNLFELLLPILLPPEVAEPLEGLYLPSPLYRFQNAGIAFLAEREAALLGDDMGLGKTVQAVVALRLLVRTGRIRGGLIVCNKAVVPQWKKHLKDWAPDLAWYAIEGTRERRRALWEALAGQSGLRCHALLATYETVRQDRGLLLGKYFDLVVLDEIQRIKNQDVGIARAIRSLAAGRRWGLSGTPLENRIEDVHSIFAFLKPGLLDPSELSPAAVRSKIEAHFLRRRKEDVLKDLPPKYPPQDQWLELTDAQRSAYDRAEQEGIVQLKSGEKVTVQHVLALITRLKQICNFDPETGESAKADFVLSHLEEICEGGHKALLFSQYVESLNMLKEWLKKFSPLVYSGELSNNRRQDVLRRFKEDPNISILLLSLKAGGIGLDLPEANFVFHFDLWWNPAVHRQAEDRVHRIGQAKAVFVRRLLTANTIEERIEDKLRYKAQLFKETIEGLADADLRQSLTEEELFGLFGLKPPRIVERERAEREWRVMDHAEFERRVAALYEGIGFRTRVTKRTRDGGVDIEGWREQATGLERILIQCKHWPNATVGEQEVRDLYGVLSSRPEIHRAILITSGRISSSARHWARGKRLELVDGVKLQALIARQRF